MPFQFIPVDPSDLTLDNSDIQPTTRAEALAVFDALHKLLEYHTHRPSPATHFRSGETLSFEDRFGGYAERRAMANTLHADFDKLAYLYNTLPE